jgi:hypothetical protein
MLVTVGTSAAASVSPATARSALSPGPLYFGSSDPYSFAAPSRGTSLLLTRISSPGRKCSVWPCPPSRSTSGSAIRDAGLDRCGQSRTLDRGARRGRRFSGLPESVRRCSASPRRARRSSGLRNHRCAGHQLDADAWRRSNSRACRLSPRRARRRTRRPPSFLRATVSSTFSSVHVQRMEGPGQPRTPPASERLCGFTVSPLSCARLARSASAAVDDATAALATPDCARRNLQLRAPARGIGHRARGARARCPA